jgi:hypothetical protein
VKRVAQLLVLGATMGAALTVAAPAGGARECDGLQVCVPVRGPWVVVPAGDDSAARPKVEWQLVCPRRHVVGGTDAEVSVAGVDVGFYGMLGSPVNPGITTGRMVTFVGSNVAPSRRTATFRPYIGCIPGAGAGTRIPTTAGAVPAGQPTTRRVRTVRVGPGTFRAVVRCERGERLVGSSHAFGFRTRSSPSPSLADGLSGTRSTQGRRVSVVVRGNAELTGVRVFVQVHAVCAGSR